MIPNSTGAAVRLRPASTMILLTLVGQFKGKLSFDGFAFTSAGSFDLFVVKLSP